MGVINDRWNQEGRGSQRPRIDLNKRFLPRPKISLHESLQPIGLKSVRIEMAHGRAFFTK